VRKLVYNSQARGDSDTSKSRRRFRAEFKFEVTLETAKGLRTLNELSNQFDVHPNQISERVRTSRSAWTAEAKPWTTSSSSARGAR
jgi:transposase-like protein